MEEKAFFLQPQLVVNDVTGERIKAIAKWARFMAVLLVIAGLICFLVTILDLSDTATEAFDTMLPTAVELILLLGVSICLGAAGLMLYKASDCLRRAIDVGDQHRFNEGLRAFRFYFVAIGILVLLAVLINFL